MIMVYVLMLEKGMKEFKQVPLEFQEDVKKEYNKRNPDNKLVD